MNVCLVIIRSTMLGIAMSAALLISLTHADERPTIARIGVLNTPNEELLRQALRERGYIEGKNVFIEWRRSNRSDDQVWSLAADLVRSQVDIIVTVGYPAAHAALEATTTIPVVFSAGDPVTSGLAASLARPGRNGTGMSVLTTELAAKRLELLHQLVPRARRIVYLMNSSNPIGRLQLEEAQKAAPMFNVQLIALDARSEAELETALRAFSRSAVDGVLVTSDLLFQANKSKIARAVRKARLPAMLPYREYLDDGTLTSTDRTREKWSGTW